MVNKKLSFLKNHTIQPHKIEQIQQKYHQDNHLKLNKEKLFDQL